MQNKTKLYTALTLGAITVLNIGLHLYRISYPPRPVFDEAHFATYAADYVKQKPFLDIHPPFGKLLYADVLALSGAALDRTDFVLFNASGTSFAVTAAQIPYADFPYVSLRLFGALFGVALACIMFFFMRSIGGGIVASLLASLFVTLENAMLLETRLILLNGMYLALGMLALTFFFKKKPYQLAGGVLWGLSLGVKLLGIAFAGPIIAAQFLYKKADIGKRALTFLAVGFAVYGALTLTNGFFYTPEERVQLWADLGILHPASSSKDVAMPDMLRRPANYIAAAAEEVLLSNSGYLAGAAESKYGNRDGSPWYLWPIMYKKMYYHASPLDSGGALILNGNPAIWFGGTLAVLATLFYIARRAYRYMRDKKIDITEQEKTLLVLLLGYVSSLILFSTIVRRVTFLYHYFPALLFAIALLALWIERIFGLYDGAVLTQKKRWAIASVTAVAVAGFLYMMPGTFGLF